MVVCIISTYISRSLSFYCKQSVRSSLCRVFNISLRVGYHVQGLVSLLKKRIQIQKDHLKAMQKLSQSVHDDHQLRQVRFEG